MNRFTNLNHAWGMGIAFALSLSGLWAYAQAPVSAEATPRSVKVEAAVEFSVATKQMMLASVKRGHHVVAVGDHGVVLVSDDEGATFRQAKVPINSTLTGVSFVDDAHGWAVGHWGAILTTTDGGNNWQLQRSDTSTDRPLFSVHFLDVNHGFAVGLWSLLLSTSDGGKTWSEVKLPPPPEGGKADRNLLRIFSDPKGTLFIAAERGVVLRSENSGETWTYLDTGYKGSFWTGHAAGDGLVIVAGLRGTIYRSADNGATWSQAKSEAKSSITDIVLYDNKIYAVGLDGVMLESGDGGASFVASQRDDRAPLTTIVEKGGHPLIFSKYGLVENR